MPLLSSYARVHPRGLTTGVLLAACFHLLLQLYNVPVANLDTAQLVAMAVRILDGGVPFTDMYDTNTPVCMYAHVIPVLIQKFTGLHIIQAISLSVLCLGAVSFMLLARVMRRSRMSDGWVFQAVTASVWIYFAAASVPVTDFSQREFLLLTGVIPYLFARHAAATDRRLPLALEVGIGLLLVFSIYLKPLHALTILLIETWVLIRVRFRLSALRFTLIIMVLAIATASLAPMRVYLFDWAPVFARYYSAYGDILKDVIQAFVSNRQFHYVVIIIVFAAVVARQLASLEHRRLLEILLLFFTGSVISALLQSKGWNYHYLPANFGGWLLAAVTLLLLVSGKNAGDIRRTAGPFVCAVFLVLQFLLLPSIWQFVPRSFSPPIGRMEQVILDHTNPSEGILNLSPSVPPAFPAITHTGRPYGGRFYVAWALPMAYEDQKVMVARKGREWLAEKYYRETCEDITRNKPRLLLIDTSRGIWSMPAEMSILSFLEYRGFFDTIGKQYHHIDNVGALRVYKR